MTTLKLTKNMPKIQKINENQITQSFNVRIIVRILSSLSNRGSLNTTSLAMHSSLNYSRCKQYLNLMKGLNWIIFEKNGRILKIRCTASGKQVMQELCKFIEKSDAKD